MTGKFDCLLRFWTHIGTIWWWWWWWWRWFFFKANAV